MYDIKNLQKLSAFSKAVPEAMASFQAFDEAALADGAIPKKYKELMVGLTTRCPYCIDVHRKAALNAGVTEQELVEATFVAAALRAGGDEGPRLSLGRLRLKIRPLFQSTMRFILKVIFFRVTRFCGLRFLIRAPKAVDRWR
jgi:AhpD family alkylhydroperoxidase